MHNARQDQTRSHRSTAFRRWSALNPNIKLGEGQWAGEEETPRYNGQTNNLLAKWLWIWSFCR